MKKTTLKAGSPKYRPDISRTLGQMANAPLALVLAQVRFSPYLSIGNFIPKIQDALRKDYPVFRHEQIQSIEFGPTPGPPKTTTEDLWNFANPENREGFVVQHNSLVFMATQYKTFGDFSTRHVKVLKSFGEIVSDVFVERLGLRCIDLIVPNSGERPEDYVIPSLHGCEMEGFPPESLQSQYMARWMLDNGQFVFRFSTGVKAPFWPSDLRSVGLENPEILKRAHEAKNVSIGRMDFDRINNHKGRFDSEELSRLFADMHENLSVAFKKSMSSLAENVWNSKS